MLVNKRGLVFVCLLLIGAVAFVGGAVQANSSTVNNYSNVNKEATQKLRDLEDKNVPNLIEQAVRSGKVSTEQKSKIDAKQAELDELEKTLSTSLVNASREERLLAINDKKVDIEAWEKVNNVPTGYLRFFSPKE